MSEKDVFQVAQEKAEQSRRCSKHPRYRGKGQPRSACCQCWSMWVGHWPTKPNGPFVNVLKKFRTAILREYTTR